MHELSLVASILEMVEQDAGQRGIKRVTYCTFDMNTATEDLQKINPDLKVFQVLCTSGEGLDSWYRWLDAKLQAKIERGSG